MAEPDAQSVVPRRITAIFIIRFFENLEDRDEKWEGQIVHVQSSVQHLFGTKERMIDLMKTLRAEEVTDKTTEKE